MTAPGAGRGTRVVGDEAMPDGWAAATQLRTLSRTLTEDQRIRVEARAVEAVIRRARNLLRHASRPTRRLLDHYPHEGELDLDATLEQPGPRAPKDIKVVRRIPRSADVVAILDMSLSMTGENVALTALSCAILKMRLDHLSVVQFDTDARPLVQMGESVSVHELVRRILTVPARGYTNVEAGLRCGLDELRRARRSRRAGIILTDGVANTGRDPVEVAAKWPRLHVVQVGRHTHQGTRTCEAMARAGKGQRYHAIIYGQLPAVVRRLVRDCFQA